MSIVVETIGRRHYLRGNTYPIKDRLRAAGAKWDPEQKSWWTGKLDVAEQIVSASPSTSAAGSAPAASATPPSSDRGGEREGDGESTIVSARATYKGRTYYVVGRVVRGRTRYDDRVESVSTRDGAKILLVFRDGSKTFWAPVQQYGHRVTVSEIGSDAACVQITKRYDRPQTIGRLAEYATDARNARAQGNDDGIPNGRTYECEECGERVTRGEGSCWETGCAH